MYKKHGRKRKFRKFHLKTPELEETKLLKIFLILSLISNYIEYNYYIQKRKNYKKAHEPILKIFVMTHKDFINYRYNPAYTIVADDESQLKNKYDLKIIFATKGKLYNMRKAYGEMSKLYYIYQLYKKGTISSKYVGINHYRRYFTFTDNIPNPDEIFKKYDAIIGNPYLKKNGMKFQYCLRHRCENYDEVIDIIKTIKPEYYKMALNVSNEKIVYLNNMFIMKKEDFLKYCEFVYDVLFEFDRRHNFTSDDDVLNYVKKYFKGNEVISHQQRMQGFLIERIANIFYYQNFKKIKTYYYMDFRSKVNKSKNAFNDSYINEEDKPYKAPKRILITFEVNSMLLLFILFFEFIKILKKFLE